MKSWMGRLLGLTAMLGAAAMTARWWSTRSVPQPSSSPQWPPFEPAVPASRLTVVPPRSDGPGTESAGPPIPSPEPTIGAEVNNIGTAGQGSLTWVLPVDGECPEGYPVKANDNSGIYHVPNGRFYARTKAERCYIDAESATADGYRAAKA